eukprot:TRINITY_DN15485_c0_g1_i1.p1 TRINITY_DN15485_c0_g1~~TRINITY_DN15485_c0_g1_i1.p1  ORF type:complete len:476 (-),score=79.38 TRINITY_DN15485_c0_g1_i1:297-1724(-)
MSLFKKSFKPATGSSGTGGYSGGVSPSGFAVGNAVEYCSQTHQRWITTSIKNVRTCGDVELERKPGYWMKPDEQKVALRLPTVAKNGGTLLADQATPAELEVTAATARSDAPEEATVPVTVPVAAPEPSRARVSRSPAPQDRAASPAPAKARLARCSTLSPARQALKGDVPATTCFVASPSWDAGEVVPGLWVGSLAAAQSDSDLLARGISRVVTIATRLKPNAMWAHNESTAIEVRLVDIDDHPMADFLGEIPPVVRRIDDVMRNRKKGTNDGVLVHCASGVSRSAAACAAWLMMRKHLSAEDALQVVKNARPEAKPNFGFVQCLQLLEESQNDLDLACDRWDRANQASRRDQEVSSFRKVAEDLLDRSNTLEEAFWQQRESEEGSGGQKTDELRKQMEQLLTELAAAEPTRTVDDSVARSIRGAAVDKMSRLFSKLGGNPAVAIRSGTPVRKSIISRRINSKETNTKDSHGTS